MARRLARRRRNPRGDAHLRKLQQRFAAGDASVLPEMSVAYQRAGLDSKVHAVAEKFTALGHLLTPFAALGDQNAYVEACYEVLALPLFEEAGELGVHPGDDPAHYERAMHMDRAEDVLSSGQWLHLFAGDVRDPSMPLGWRRPWPGERP